ncbi:MAG TPA: hypothetical protein VG735_15940 [Caulobacterales bacterium]|nr:hypothetical protein [Caulobacterales bacterium]
MNLISKSGDKSVVAGFTLGQVRFSPAVLITAFVLLIRLPNAFYAGMDWDETTYSMVAVEILKGHLPYTVVFDHKPMGLYWVFAAFIGMFGYDPFATRLMAIAAVAGAAITLHHIATKRFGLSAGAALVLALIYAFATGGIGGSAVNSEILINAATMGWLALLLKNPERPGALSLLGAGALMAWGVQFNYLAGALIVGFVAGYGVLAWTVRSSLVERARFFALNGLTIFAGFALMNLAILAPLLVTGLFPSYFAEQTQYLSGYKPDIDNLRDMMLQLERSLPYLTAPVAIVACAIWMAFRRTPAAPPVGGVSFNALSIVVGGVLLGAAAAALTSGRFYPHYFLQVLPPLFVLLALSLAAVLREPALRTLAMGVLAASGAMMGGDALAFDARGIKGAVEAVLGLPPTADPYRALAADLRPRLAKDETIYVACEHHVLYELLDVTAPTKYPYYMHHLDSIMSAALKIDPKVELAHIAQKKPRFVVLGDFPRCTGVTPANYDMVVDTFTKAGYRLDGRYFNGRIFVSNNERDVAPVNSKMRLAVAGTSGMIVAEPSARKTAFKSLPQ